MTLAPPIAPLFVPASRPERFEKAAASGADAIIIDLEDAVDPHGKDAARTAIQRHCIDTLPVYIRVNAAGTPWHADDVEALKDVPLAGIVLPKAESADSVTQLRRKFGREIPVLPLIESACGMEARQAVLSAPGVFCAIFGSLDYGLDMGCLPDWEPLLPARMSLVQTSRSLGLAAPIDGVTTDIRNLSMVAADAGKARDHGFGGKLAIHPAQVGPILNAFEPGEEQVAWAGRVIEAVRSGGAVCIVDGAMVDAPVIKKAQQILQRAK
jgi:citrate lyase subunit beta / citryl-CoA lyase